MSSIYPSVCVRLCKNSFMQPLFPCEESFLWPQLLDLTGLKICRGLKYAHQVFSEYLLISPRLLIRDISEFLDNSQNFVSCFVFPSSTRVCVCIVTTMSFSRSQTTWFFFFQKKLDRLWASFAGMTQCSNKSINGNKTATFESILQLSHRDVIPFRCAPNALAQSDNHNYKSEDPVFSPMRPLLSAGQAGAALVISAPLSCNTKAASGESVRGEPVRLGEGYKMRCVTLPWHPPKSIGSRDIGN